MAHSSSSILSQACSRPRPWNSCIHSFCTLIVLVIHWTIASWSEPLLLLSLSARLSNRTLRVANLLLCKIEQRDFPWGEISSQVSSRDLRLPAPFWGYVPIRGVPTFASFLFFLVAPSGLPASLTLNPMHLQPLAPLLLLLLFFIYLFIFLTMMFSFSHRKMWQPIGNGKWTDRK